MDRREFLYGLGGGAAGALVRPELPALSKILAPGKQQRGLKICVSKDADPALQKAAHSLLESVTSHSLLKTMASEAAPAIADTAAALNGSQSELAYSHLIVIGLTGDPLIAAATQHEIRIAAKQMYVFGYGYLDGDIGYIESDRNPFLHAATIPTAPFETQLTSLTGNTNTGVDLAVRAFRDRELVNGVVAKAGWVRPKRTLLDRDPIDPRFDIPQSAPQRIGDYTRIGITQASEEEYRGVLADTGFTPQTIWRIKYFKSGAWDGAGIASAFDNYAAGLHRRSYGNTLWIAEFANSAEADKAAVKIAEAARLQKQSDIWVGSQPQYANGSYPGEKASSGPLKLWKDSHQVFMSTVPA